MDQSWCVHRIGILVSACIVPYIVVLIFSLYRRVDTDFILFSSEISSNQEFLRKQ